MLRYLVKRIAHGLFIMWLVATTVFFGMRLIPGGPVRSALGQEAREATVRAMREQLGLTRPLPIQYLDWMTDLVFLDLGVSITKSEPVATLIMQAAPKTLSISLIAIVIGLLIAIPTGIVSATRKNEPADYVATVVAFLGISMPAFFIGILLALVFGIWFNLLPVIGYTPLHEGVIPWLRSILLPGIAVGLPYAAVVMRMMRSSLLDVLNQPYMMTAVGKGVHPYSQLFKHALQNAMIPVVTIAGIQVALILVGSVTVELVFAIQGLGRLLVNSMLAQDNTVTQGVIILVAGVMIATNIIVDLVYTMIDPRIRYEEGQ